MNLDADLNVLMPVAVDTTRAPNIYIDISSTVSLLSIWHKPIPPLTVAQTIPRKFSSAIILAARGLSCGRTFVSAIENDTKTVVNSQQGGMPPVESQYLHARP